MPAATPGSRPSHGVGAGEAVLWAASRESICDLALGSKRLLLLTNQCENEALLQYNQTENIQVTITQVVLHSKRNNQQNENATHRMGESIFKRYI